MPSFKGSLARRTRPSRAKIRAAFGAAFVLTLGLAAEAREHRAISTKRPGPRTTPAVAAHSAAKSAPPVHQVVARAAMRVVRADHGKVSSVPTLARVHKEDTSLVLAFLESAAPVHDADDVEPEPRSSAKKKRDEKKAKKVRPVRPLPPGATWKAYRRAPWRRGYVTMTGHGKRWAGYVIGPDGEVNPGARQALSSELASWRTGKQVAIDDRLIGLIADVSDEFGGRPIRVVSGYRESSYAPDSKHKVGQAFDFSVPGVPNEMLRDFLRSLPDVGVGYYPNSTHVHVDVREKPCYWVDYSRPGQRPLYSYDRHPQGLSPAERALTAALDTLLHHTFGGARSRDGEGKGRHEDAGAAKEADAGARPARPAPSDIDEDDEVEPLAWP